MVSFSAYAKALADDVVTFFAGMWVQEIRHNIITH
jgi:hypothetical protein